MSGVVVLPGPDLIEGLGVLLADRSRDDDLTHIVCDCGRPMSRFVRGTAPVRCTSLSAWFARTLNTWSARGAAHEHRA